MILFFWDIEEYEIPLSWPDGRTSETRRVFSIFGVRIRSSWLRLCSTSCKRRSGLIHIIYFFPLFSWSLSLSLLALRRVRNERGPKWVPKSRKLLHKQSKTQEFFLLDGVLIFSFSSRTAVTPVRIIGTSKCLCGTLHTLRPCVHSHDRSAICRASVGLDQLAGREPQDQKHTLRESRRKDF